MNENTESAIKIFNSYLRKMGCDDEASRYWSANAVGGYISYTEYEVGAQRIAEEAHCILGSLHKLAVGSWKDVELGHIQEEIDLMKYNVNEYAKPLYIDRVWDGAGEYAKQSLEDIRSTSPMLREQAECALGQLRAHRSDIDPEDYRLAEECYRLLINLADKMERSVRDADDKPRFNAFATMQDDVRRLDSVVKECKIK